MPGWKNNSTEYLRWRSQRNGRRKVSMSRQTSNSHCDGSRNEILHRMVPMPFGLCRLEKCATSVRVVDVFIFSLPAVRFVKSPENLPISKEEATTACYNRYTEKSPLVGQHIWHWLQSSYTQVVSYVHPAIKKASMLRFSTPRKECTPAYLTATIRKITNRRDMAIPSAPHER